MSVPPAVANHINNGIKANQVAYNANSQISSGNAVSSNLSRTNKAANDAVSNYSAAVNKLPNNINNNLKRAKDRFTKAAIESGANRPLNAVNNARQGINSLVKYANAGRP